jgi:Flp pilus assembly protein TadD
LPSRETATDTPAWYYLADACEKDGDLAEALRHVRQALSLDPQSPESKGLLGRILLRQERPAEAVPTSNLAVAKKPTDQELRYHLARALQKLGRRDDAAREFAEVRRLKEEQLKLDRSKTPQQ